MNSISISKTISIGKTISNRMDLQRPMAPAGRTEPTKDGLTAPRGARREIRTSNRWSYSAPWRPPGKRSQSISTSISIVFALFFPSMQKPVPK